MARLQILELPEGTSDERPPYVLVVDECAPQRIIIGMDHGPVRDYWHGVAERTGARGVIVTAETVEIPANDVSAEFRAGLQGAVAELYESARRSLSESETLGHTLLQRAEQAEAVTTHTKGLMERRTRTLRERAERAEEKLTALGKQETERMDAITDALGFDRLRDWDEIVAGIKEQRQTQVDGGHRFLAVPPSDGGLRCSVCGVPRDLWGDLPDAPSCATVKGRGYF